jgi:hypothetical protein
LKLRQINAGLVVTIALPVFAILGSTAAAVIAFTQGDAVLPGQYHWEGQQLDRDFASSQRAAALGVQARLWLLDGTCRLSLQVAGQAPSALELRLVHGTQPELDRRVHLLRTGNEGKSDGYEGSCGTPPAGLWHVELLEPTGAWSLQEDVSGPLDGARIAATAVGN